jgi:hypothetical protein
VGALSQFEREPAYYSEEESRLTPMMAAPFEVERVEPATEEELMASAWSGAMRFAQLHGSGSSSDSGSGSSAASESSAAASVNEALIDGDPGFALDARRGFPPGHYWPPPMPYRFPSYPYDNPTYSPWPSMFSVPLPPPWRSDALNINSDGARYLQNMERYDYFAKK